MINRFDHSSQARTPCPSLPSGVSTTTDPQKSFSQVSGDPDVPVLPVLSGSLKCRPISPESIGDPIED